MLNYEDVMNKTNTQYRQLKLDQGLISFYTAPELLPNIESDQIKALAKVLIDEINNELNRIYGQN
jgi:hypothetical protein